MSYANFFLSQPTSSPTGSPTTPLPTEAPSTKVSRDESTTVCLSMNYRIITLLASCSLTLFLADVLSINNTQREAYGWPDYSPITIGSADGKSND